ncbi:hypothetical protein NKG94_40385 [Micromonospora sp. M12]
MHPGGAARRGPHVLRPGAARRGVRMFDHTGGTKVRLVPLPGETEHWYSVVY